VTECRGPGRVLQPAPTSRTGATGPRGSGADTVVHGRRAPMHGRSHAAAAVPSRQVDRAVWMSELGRAHADGFASTSVLSVRDPCHRRATSATHGSGGESGYLGRRGVIGIPFEHKRRPRAVTSAEQHTYGSRRPFDSATSRDEVDQIRKVVGRSAKCPLLTEPPAERNSAQQEIFGG
jgi:hypothetical protein